MLGKSGTALSTGDLKDGWTQREREGEGERPKWTARQDWRRNRGHSQHSFSTKMDRDSMFCNIRNLRIMVPNKYFFQINIFNFFLKRYIKKKKKKYPKQNLILHNVLAGFSKYLNPFYTTGWTQSSKSWFTHWILTPASQLLFFPQRGMRGSMW